MKQRRWLCLMPHPYGWGNNQGRDIGALANGLRQLGENAEFYVMDDRIGITDSLVKLASHEQLSSVEWWISKGDGILLTTFGTNLMLPVYAAAKQAGWSVWARMDCDGIPGPDGNKRKYLTGQIVEKIDRRRRRKCDLSGTLAGACEGTIRAAAGLLLAKRVRQRLWASYKLIDSFLVETPLARNSFTRYFSQHGSDQLAARVHLMPPAIAETFQFRKDMAKSGVVAVGQWFRWQKNLDLLVKTVAGSLKRDPDLKWTIVGNGSHFAEDLLQNTCRIPLPNVRFYPHTCPGELAEIYAKAYVIFYSSRQEGFPNTLCEALCSGATMVAPRGIQAFEYCESRGWGTLYDKPSETASTVLTELASWQAGRRNPKLIAADTGALFHRKNVAIELCKLRKTKSQGQI